MSNRWSRSENEIVLDAYMDMLRWERLGRPFVKVDVCRSILPQLPGRSHKAIEYKFRNISAVLNDAGHSFVDGYKPAGNYQQQLQEQVLARINLD